MNNTLPLQPGERIDDLLTHDLRIIQSEEVFSFSMDAVLLARFVSLPQRGRLLDLCTGNGVIPLLMTTRTKALIDGVEIQPRLADMAKRSVMMNGLSEKIAIMEGDLRTFHMTKGYGVYDVVTVNPPYMPANTGDKNVNEYVAIARHEIYCTLEEVTAACSRLVRTGGRVAMVHRPGRLADLIDAMRRVRLEPKRVRFVHPYADREANMVLIEAIRDGKPDLRLLPPLIVYNEQMEYSMEVMDIYYGQHRMMNEE
ncbi:tRNA1(Val) (adenine(37)-N6)-methyltransferase [Paenibacillus tarimensis]